MDKITYKIKRSKRAKRVRLTVCCDAEVVVTVPNRFDMSIVERFIAEKSDWIKSKIAYFGSRSQRSFAGGPREEYLKFKEEARKLVLERLEYFNAHYGFVYKRISIKNQKSRWGSCSRSGNLNFNYKLALLPPECADYIIVHELCHLKELNHSQRFWHLVSEAIPDYKRRIALMRGLRD